MKDFADIYEEYAKQIYVFLMKLCGNEILAEELTDPDFHRATYYMGIAEDVDNYLGY